MDNKQLLIVVGVLMLGVFLMIGVLLVPDNAMSLRDVLLDTTTAHNDQEHVEKLISSN
jgi:hypothetical protein